MKRKMFLFFLVILVFLFNSCVSFDVPASRSQGSEPRYESNVYSSNLSQIDFEKDAGIIVFCDILDNSLMQVATEKNIVDALERRGVRAYSFSSYTIPDETIDNLVSQMYDLAEVLNCRYLYSLSYEEFYTFEFGGGISNVYFDSVTIDREYQEISVRVTGAVFCDENEFQSFNESLEIVYDCIGKAVADEFIKYSR